MFRFFIVVALLVAVAQAAKDAAPAPAKRSFFKVRWFANCKLKNKFSILIPFHFQFVLCNQSSLLLP